MARGRLYNLGSFPGLKRDHLGPHDFVFGELYRVRPDILRELDLVEGVGRGFYERREIVVAGRDASTWMKAAQAYVYCGPVKDNQRIPSFDDIESDNGEPVSCASWRHWKDGAMWDDKNYQWKTTTKLWEPNTRNRGGA